MPPTTPSHPPAPAAAARAGLSLVELLVALTVLAAGVLALAGVAAGIARASLDATRALRAAALVDARVESLVVAPCADALGEAEHDGLRERWTVRADGPLLALADTVRHELPGRPAQALGAAALRWCGP